MAGQIPTAAHILARVARWQGRSVFAFTRHGDAAARGFARSLGAVWAGGSNEMPPEPLDAAIVFATAGILVPQALKAVRKGGRVLCAGIHMSDIPSFPYSILWEERQILSKQVDTAVSHGANILMGGKRIDRPGAFMQPTILTDVAPENPAFRDEFFGPVAMFFPVKDEDAAIALANDSDFGLGGSVFTKDIARGKRVASRVDTGGVL